MPIVLAGVAFFGFLLAFGWELFAYQHKVVEWARRDLQSRADLAAANLEAPLRTQDFRKIHALGDQCDAEGVRLVISGRAGGRLFDSRRVSEKELPSFSANAASGDYIVSIGIPASRVYAPFHLAIVGFCLAGLVGMAGVLLFFFVTYRQRVRIRELAKVEAFRRTFIADVSHEIKTPLTGILGAVEMLGEGKRGETGEERREALLVGMIRKESKRLQTLVQEILDLARLERDGEKLERVETDLAALVADVAARYRTVRVRADRPVTAVVDPRLIERALSNLLENAIRHSGSEDIAVSLVPPGADGFVRLVVEDCGVGIPPEHLSHIFERFHRVDPARAAESGGAGLGLSIVRRIARLHGGEVTCENVAPHGARFVLTIPAESRC